MKTDLVYDEFKEFEVARDYGTDIFDKIGYNHAFRFPNNYGASVIKHVGSYGYEKDLFELAVLEYENGDDENHGWLCYDTEITDDVIGYLSNEEVLELLNKIKAL